MTGKAGDRSTIRTTTSEVLPRHTRGAVPTRPLIKPTTTTTTPDTGAGQVPTRPRIEPAKPTKGLPRNNLTLDSPSRMLRG